jgi:hypothetical protein
MFDIVNNVVKEMILMRSPHNTLDQSCSSNKCQINTPFRKEIVLPSFESIDKIDVSVDDEEDEEDDEDEEDEEDDEEEDEEEGEGEKEENQLIHIIKINEEIGDLEVTEINGDSIDDDDEYIISTFDIIDIPILTRQQNMNGEMKEIDLHETPETQEEKENIEEKQTIEEQPEEEKENIEENQENIEEKQENIEEKQEEQPEEKESIEEADYKKMNTQSLKNLVMSKGLFKGKDINKLKKWELLKLLDL